ncbi:MAG: hypothetical protein SGI72_09295 [Planctomycetota bacterium]|nr:hypothetical protein [Planctomycetota bacterium]
MKFEQVPRICVALGLVIASGCGIGDAPESPSSANQSESVSVSSYSSVDPGKPTQTKSKTKGAVKLPVLPTPVDLPAVTERSSLLQRLPKSTLCVLRLPHVEKFGEAYERTILRDLIDRPEAAAQREQLSAFAAQFESDLRSALPDFDALRTQVAALQGEAVFALVSIDTAALGGKSPAATGLPFTCAVMLDVGARADLVESLVKHALTALENPSSKSARSTARVQREATDATHWRIRISTDTGEIDALRDGAQFCFNIGPATTTPAVDHPLVMRETEDSFLAAAITRGTKDLSHGGGVVVVEAFVNLEPVWNAVDVLAPAEVRNVLAASGATSIRGLSAVAAMGVTGIDEELFVMSPGGKDLLTRCVTNRPLEAAIARYLPEDASSASISTFDLTALFDGVAKLLPDATKREFEGTLVDIKKGGFDLRADLIDNIGPTFAVTGEFELARMFQSDGSARAPEFTIIAQVVDGERLRGVIDALLTRSGARANARAKDIHGFKAYGMDPIALPVQSGAAALYFEPHWYVGDDVFVFSSSRAALARSLAAAWKEDNRGPREIKAALTRESGAFAISMNAVDGRRAVSPTIGRRTSIGLEITTKEGAGNVTAYSFMSFAGLASSIALPSLIAARTAADERAAVATLRSIAAAQQEFRAGRLLDADADLEGEFATLSELTAAIALRNGNSALATPLLSAELAPSEDGLVRARGFVFRVDLSNRLTRRIDFDEKEFFAYAWPEFPNGSLRRAFVIDASGTVLATDNDEPEQNYAGVERMPKSDASKRVKSGSSKVNGNVQRSLDGGVWRDL